MVVGVARLVLVVMAVVMVVVGVVVVVATFRGVMRAGRFGLVVAVGTVLS